MAAPEGNQNALGNKGATLNDRKKAAKARNLILDEVVRLFETDPLKLSETEHATKRELLIKMAPHTLPRLTEVTGEDGEPVRIVFDKSFERVHASDTTPETTGDSNKPSEV